MGRATRGVRGIMLAPEDELAAMLRVAEGQAILLVTENGYGKRVEFDNFMTHSRGTRGQMIYVPEDLSGEVVGAVSIGNEDEVMVITSTGKTIKVEAETIRVCGKGARGVRIVNIEPPDSVIGLDKIVKEEDPDNYGLGPEVVGVSEGNGVQPEKSGEPDGSSDSGGGDSPV